MNLSLLFFKNPFCKPLNLNFLPKPLACVTCSTWTSSETSTARNSGTSSAPNAFPGASGSQARTAYSRAKMLKTSGFKGESKTCSVAKKWTRFERTSKKCSCKGKRGRLRAGTLLLGNRWWTIWTRRWRSKCWGMLRVWIMIPLLMIYSVKVYRLRYLLCSNLGKNWLH